MSRNKKPTISRKTETSIVRSSAAEYLTFVVATGTGGVEAIYADESIWLTQKMMGMLYDVETHTINYHLKKIFSDSELQEDSVIRNFRITAADGKNYNTKHYKLSTIIAVGYKVNSERAVQFRKWATTIVQDRLFESDFDRVVQREHQAEYSQALQESTRQTDSAPFIAFMLRMILETVVTSAPQVSPQVTPPSRRTAGGYPRRDGP